MKEYITDQEITLQCNQKKSPPEGYFFADKRIIDELAYIDFELCGLWLYLESYSPDVVPHKQIAIHNKSTIKTVKKLLNRLFELGYITEEVKNG